ncbi:ABC transporter permease subunit [Methanonatronarchaeum sp. AMET6-2]|uniref:ABC transporter permease subunit n=1 Tax=Methanonatronarchaeum sp. AMET6-2 TaxID=2933293 RepID=UPI0012111C7B|nr:ABC transporter permease subunit [Methanonatronarchaeum sp. AMET6-2]RZN63072.1 MAG: ABC transporter permease [Methanonatronarchaeia archaeon]UOY09594.1 ABC transporter permease [Methanonatronarchaeum sp. AMET6-2]
MRWPLIARKDFDDAIRSKVFLILIGVFILIVAGGVYAVSLIPEGFFGEQVPLTSDFAVIALQSIFMVFVPLIALVAVFGSIAGERDSNSLRVLLSFPYSRLDVVLGKFIGRALVVTIPILIGFAVAAVVILGVYEDFYIQNYLIFTLLTILLAWSFIGIGIGFSAAAKTRTMAIGLAAGVYLLFLVFWDIIYLLIHYIVRGGVPGVGDWPEWLILIDSLNPISAFGYLSSRYIGLEQFHEFMNPLTLMGRDTLPFYLSEPALVIYLLLWMVVPVVLGYVYFKKSDIS